MLSHKPLFYIAFYCYVFTPKKITNNITLPLKNITNQKTKQTQAIVKFKLAPINLPHCYLLSSHLATNRTSIPFSHHSAKALVFRTTICYTGYIR
jgi:hypothetical protein